MTSVAVILRTFETWVNMCNDEHLLICYRMIFRLIFDLRRTNEKKISSLYEWMFENNIPEEEDKEYNLFICIHSF